MKDPGYAYKPIISTLSIESLALEIIELDGYRGPFYFCGYLLSIFLYGYDLSSDLYLRLRRN